MSFSHPSYFSRDVPSKTSAGQRSIYNINDHLQTHYGSSSNSLLFRSVFLRYMKKRRPLLVLLLCVILISLSYLFMVSGGLQLKKHEMEREVLSAYRFRREKLLNTDKEEVLPTYSNKLKRLNKSIQNVIAYGKVSLLNDEIVSDSSVSNKDHAGKSDIKYNKKIQRKRKMYNSSQFLNDVYPENTFFDVQKQVDVRKENYNRPSKLNYEDENNHSSQ